VIGVKKAASSVTEDAVFNKLTGATVTFITEEKLRYANLVLGNGKPDDTVLKKFCLSGLSKLQTILEKVDEENIMAA
jgi:hypothetical protein